MRDICRKDFPGPPAGKKEWPWSVTDSYSPEETTNGEIESLPFISVVTPSYNQGGFIEETIRSVLLQGYPKLEYIIIDGGSTDNTVEIIKKYEPWIDYWVSEPDRGQTHAINKGFAKAKGDILAWLNSDDMYLRGALFKVAKAFAETQADLVYGRSDLLFSDGSLKQQRLREPDPGVRFLKNWISQPAAFWKRKVWEEVGPLDEYFHICMDFDFWLKVFRGGYKMVGIDEVLALFRIHGESKTYNDSKPNEIWIKERLEVFLRHQPELETFIRGVYTTNRMVDRLFSFSQQKLLLKLKKILKLALVSIWVPFYGKHLVKHVHHNLSSGK